MRKYLATLIWPVICGVLLALVILNYLPQFIGSEQHNKENTRDTMPRSGSYADAVSRASPAVVTVSSLRQLSGEGSPLSDDPIYQPFQPQESSEQPINLGSGVIVDHQGYILTNNHVVRSADQIVVTLADGRTTSAQLVGSDPDTDLAVLKVSLSNLPTVMFANSNTIRTGDIALAIGNPFNIGQSVTMGIVSAVGRASLGLSAYEDFIQTDASINPGNSGGALINAEGQLIGINTAIFSRSGGSQGIGFAIPTNVARGVLQAIIEHGRVERGYLGIEAQNQATLQQSLNIKSPGNIVVTHVTKGGPADKAGVQVGDYILAINNAPLLDPTAAITEIANLRPGSNITVTLLRNQQSIHTHIKVGVRPPNLATIYNSILPNQKGEDKKNSTTEKPVQP